MSLSEQIAEINERLRAIETAIAELTDMIHKMSKQIPDKLIVS